MTKNPHDMLFKAEFSDPNKTRAFLQHYLPAEVLAVLDMDSLKLEKDSFVAKNMRSYFSDLVYSVQSSSGAGYVYILFEHKSYKDKQLPLQLLKYMVRLYDAHLKRNKKAQKLPFVIPVVLYHGRQGLESTGQFMDMMPGQGPELSNYVPNFRFELVNLTEEADDDLWNISMINGLLLLLKHIWDTDLTERLPEIWDMLMKMGTKETGFEAMEVYLRYIMSAAKNTDPDELRETLQDIGGEFMPSLAKKIFDEGKQEGILEGIQKGKQEGILEGMRDGLVYAIADLLEIRFGSKSLSLMKKVKKINDPDKLIAIKNLIKTAKTLQEVQDFLD